jgi:ADP-ribose pyrophosphatase
VSGLRDEPTEDFAVLDSRLAFCSGRVVDVRTDEVRMPDGDTAVRDVVVHPGAVAIVALDDEQRVLLLRQYRHPVRRRLWEPPAGLLDEPGEEPLQAARRELFEETHCRAGRWDVLVDLFTSPGMCDEAVRIYLARDVRDADEPRHVGVGEEAELVVRWVPLGEAVAAVLAGDLHNPLAALGLLATARAVSNGFRELRPADTPWPEMSDFAGSAAAEPAS